MFDCSFFLKLFASVLAADGVEGTKLVVALPGHELGDFQAFGIFFNTLLKSHIEKL